jgi:hypothetical protein
VPDAAEWRAAFREDRFLAHEKLFAHRHEYPFAPFHPLLVDDFWSQDWRYVDLGFRECGKTTLVEEGIAVAACEEAFSNCLIIGAKEELAAELLANIKSELENNDALLGIYGDQRGEIWTQTKITLKGGHCIQARGVGQTMRGTQHRNRRPDLVIINDFEDDEELLTPEGRRRTLRWFLKVLLPACDRARRKIRIYDTVRDADSVPMRLIKHEGWPHRIIPVSWIDGDGEERSSWPGHPTLTPEWIASERQTYVRLGEADIWEREYMCSAESQADRTFTSEMIRVMPQIRAWQAVYAMIDPARTIKRTSATTGWAVWSWVNNRLIVWEAGARRLLPDEIVDLAFRIARDYNPIEIGVEEDGLNEWLLQPIRQRMFREGLVIPCRGVRAPRGKVDFIRGLQPFFANGEAILAAEMPDLRDQLLAFPTGRIDAPNALAYALLIRPGRMIYENWNPNSNISVTEAARHRPLYLAADATGSRVAVALLQLLDDRTAVLADWISEGDAGAALEGIVRQASMAVGGSKLILVAGAKHWQQYNNVGLVQAARGLGLEVRQGGDPERGRAFLRKEIGRLTQGGPAFVAAPAARWTLNALAGGYSLPLRDGHIAGAAADNGYKVLMEGIEALAGLFAFGLEEEDDDAPGNFGYDSAGHRYRSALPPRMLRQNARH